ncbi:hypothetical protein ACJU26_04325 [Acidithiobacillus sp. M4-SHS-6]|uniref:hypothetical protein n=1 Tax=Acidithiobacillus sp. M4-SHS-6 TaxID=3383024 RepID=UPI0039BDE436
MKKTLLLESGSIYGSSDAPQAISESRKRDPQELLRRHVTANWNTDGAVVSSWQIGGYTAWIHTDATSTIIDLALEP